MAFGSSQAPQVIAAFTIITKFSREAKVTNALTKEAWRRMLEYLQEHPLRNHRSDLPDELMMAIRLYIVDWNLPVISAEQIRQPHNLWHNYDILRSSS